MINRKEIIEKADELEDLLVTMSDFDHSKVLLDEYAIHIQALKSMGDIYPYDQAIRIGEIRDVIESRLPNVSDEVFEQYVVYINLLAICLE